MSGGNGVVDIQKEAFKKTISEIQEHAGKIFDLMLPGMSIDLTIPNNNNILVPNAKKEVRRLILIRPQLAVTITSK